MGAFVRESGRCGSKVAHEFGPRWKGDELHAVKGPWGADLTAFDRDTATGPY
jgi:hypothetical protein